MGAPISRHIPLPGTFNVRDLGGYATVDGRVTQWRRMLRSDSLHKLDADGIERLVDEGVAMVVDLRHDSELLEAPNPFSTRPGFHYVNINLFADLLPRGDAAHDSTVDVLLDLYLRALEERGAVIREVLEAIAAAPDGAILFHCAAGKDRTGILAALLLSIANVDRGQILDDYELTAAQIESVIPDYETRARERGQDLASLHAMLAARRETMQAMLDYLDERHEGPLAYLAALGLSSKAVERLRNRILQDETA